MRRRFFFAPKASGEVPAYSTPKTTHYIKRRQINDLFGKIPSKQGKGEGTTTKQETCRDKKTVFSRVPSTLENTAYKNQTQRSIDQ